MTFFNSLLTLATMISLRTGTALLAAALLASVLPAACTGGRRQPHAERLKFLRHGGGILLAVPDSFFVEERPYGYTISLAGPKDLRAPEQLEVLIRRAGDDAAEPRLPGFLCARIDSVDGPAGRYYAARVRLRYGETVVLLYQPDRNPRLDMPTFDLLRRTQAGVLPNCTPDACDAFDPLGGAFEPGATDAEPLAAGDAPGIEEAWEMPGLSEHPAAAAPVRCRNDSRMHAMYRPVHCRDST